MKGLFILWSPENTKCTVLNSSHVYVRLARLICCSLLWPKLTTSKIISFTLNILSRWHKIQKQTWAKLKEPFSIVCTFDKLKCYEDSNLKMSCFTLASNNIPLRISILLLLAARGSLSRIRLVLCSCWEVQGLLFANKLSYFQ